MVALPDSEILDNAHVQLPCTRVQFAANACPPGSVLGYAKAETPLLGGPLKGSFYLRSNPEHELPDLVLALHNDLVDFDAVNRIDSVKGGGIRNTFEAVPDVPLAQFVLEMDGGRKGLLENSTNLCKGRNRATVKFDGQNGKEYNTTPKVAAKCPKAKKAGKGKSHKHR